MEISLSQQNEPTLADLIAKVRDTIRRRWKMLALVTAVVFVMGTVLTFLMTPQYLASARIRIDPSRDPVAAQGGDKTVLSKEAIDTEVSAFYSQDLATTVARNLDLLKDPDFAAGTASLPKKADREAAIAAKLSQNLSVAREAQTYVLSVGFESADPVKAARIANAFAESYISGAVGARTSVASSQSEWYQEQLRALNEQVRSADAAAARFRAQNGLALGGSESGAGASTITDQQIPALSSSLADARSNAAQARANALAAQAEARRTGAGAVAEVLNSTVITSLRQRRADILVNKAELEAQYGHLHPAVQKIAEQLRDTDRQIAEESARIIASLNVTAKATEARAASLRASLDDIETQRASQTQANVIADSLSREAQAKRDLYKQMTEESLQALQSSQNSMSSATILDKAVPPRTPHAPNKPVFMALALIIGLLAGAGTIATQELMAGTVLRSEDVEEKLGLRLLAAVPNVAEMHPAAMLLDRPTSFYAEAFRIARGAILGSSNTRSDIKVLAFTSAVPGEGKTTTSLSFARTLAVAGLRTLIIDCDLRRATLAGAAEFKAPDKGLVEYLSGQASLDDVIFPSGLENLDIVAVREPHFASTNLFESGLMKQLVSAAAQSYDHVILDLPPVMGLADGRILASYAEALVFVIRWNETPISLVENAIDALQKSGITPAGAIVNAVAESADSLGSYYYQSRYSYYYHGDKK